MVTQPGAGRTAGFTAITLELSFPAHHARNALDLRCSRRLVDGCSLARLGRALVLTVVRMWLPGEVIEIVVTGG